MYCWGSNARGQVDPLHPSDRDAMTRRRVPNLPIMRAVGVGRSHVCALADNGEVWCWGRSNWAQLGAEGLPARPTAVEGVSGATAIAVGENFSCALVQNGRVRCWGYSGNGQAGVRGNAAGPRDIAGLRGARRIVAGEDHACAQTGSSRVVCWGSNQGRQLGDGTRRASPRPRRVVGLSGTVTALGAGSHHSCAVVDDALWCWGGHGLGPEGSSEAESGRPVRLEAFGSVRGVVGGKSAVCAVTQDGGARCAGVNDDGQLGTAPAVFAPAAQPVEGIAATRELSLGLNHGCARGEDSVVRCWGSNRDGQCGQPTGGAAVASLRPLAVPLPGPARHISAGGDHSCALLQDGQVACWGSDTSGSRGSRAIPAMIGVRGAPEIIPGVQNAAAVGAGGSGTCILTTARELYCVSSDLHDLAADWGRSGDYGFSRVPLPSTESFDLDGLSGCAVDGEGVSCFDVGNNISTVRFDGVASPPFRPAAVGFSIGGSCALSTDGRVACWGRAFDGRLGDGSTEDRDEPGLVPGLSGVRSLAVGSRHRCALDADGAAYCWGSHRRGSTGSTSATPLPNRVAGVSRGRQLDVGSSHACAVTEGGQVYCWGNDRWGQCGQRFSSSSPSAHLVRGLPTINEVDVGESHSCALATDGRVFCWGKASSGQLGNGQSRLILPARPVQR